MADGKALSLFNDFMSTTQPTFLGGPERIINEARKHSWMIRKLLFGRNEKEVFTTGTKAVVHLMFDENSNASTYLPGESVSFENPQVLDEADIELRYVWGHASWTAQELAQNDGMTREAMKTNFRRLKYVKQMRVWTDILKTVDGYCWASAHDQQAAMEDASGAAVFSVAGHITEDASAYHPQGWTTIEGIDPATQTGWRNQVETYDYDDPDDSDGDGDGLERAFDNMHMKLQWELPGKANEYFENPSLYRTFIATSRLGMNVYRDLLRDRNDRTYTQTSLARPTLDWSGIELRYISDLDTATLYDSAGTGGIGGSAGTWTSYVAEASANYDGARYYWINGNYMKFMFHPSRFFKQHEVREIQTQIDAFSQPYTVWLNLVNESRSVHGVVSPNA